MSRPRTITQSARPAFTLIELLIVLAIVAVLVTLSVAAAMKVLGAQSGGNTKTLLARLNSTFGKQWSATADQARKNYTANAGTALQMANGDTERSKVIHLKLALRQGFPVTFQEVFGASGPEYNPPAAYVAYLQQSGVTASTSLVVNGVDAQSSALFLMALQRGPSNTGVNLEDLGVGSSVRTVAVPGGSTIPILVDAWGNPIVFCRWPTGDPSATPAGKSAVNANGWQPGANDPGDPKGLLTSSSWVGRSGWKAFILFHPLPSKPDGTSIPGVSANFSPCLISAGPDGQLGLNPTTLAVTNAAQATDNIYSQFNP